jgi:hypothetical protein
MQYKAYFLYFFFRTRGRIVPRCPPSIWSVHSRTIDGIPRTNNLSEGYNNGLKQTLKKNARYLSPRFFAEVLVGEESMAITKYLHYIDGKADGNRYWKSDFSQFLIKQMSKYGTIPQVEFLKGAASHFNYSPPDRDEEQKSDTSEDDLSSSDNNLSSD